MFCVEKFLQHFSQQNKPSNIAIIYMSTEDMCICMYHCSCFELFSVPRLVIVENLPASTNVDEKLNELFPDAIKTISFQYNPTAQGYVWERSVYNIPDVQVSHIECTRPHDMYTI